MESSLHIPDRADAVTDSYEERVTRNEGRLAGLETLVAETREADRKLIEQRSESLARELERRAEALLELVTARADAVLSLAKEQREADRREVEQLRETLRREGEMSTTLLREMYDRIIGDIRESVKEGLILNLDQSQTAIHELELRRKAETDRLEQMVRQWRESDREARELFAAETTRHLEQLNHNNERMAKFQAESVTRELWQAEKDATSGREDVLRDQIVALDRSLLTMTPMTASDKAHREMTERWEASMASAARVLETQVGALAEKVEDLKSSRDTTTGRSAGYTALYGWGVAALGALATVVVLANAFTK